MTTQTSPSHKGPNAVSLRDSLDAVHPVIRLRQGGGRDAVDAVVALDDPSIGLGLAGFDHLVLVVWDEELKAVLRGK